MWHRPSARRKRRGRLAALAGAASAGYLQHAAAANLTLAMHNHSAEVEATFRDRPERVSIVATGRDAPAWLIDLADTVTVMENRKHAYETGIAAKKGIDY